MCINDLIKIIRASGNKITPQRKSILEVLLSFNNNLISAEMLYNQLKNTYTKTDLSTVYRNLGLFERLDIVHRVVTENGVSSYKLACTNTHHHHIICKGCGKTEIVNFCPMKYLDNIFKNNDFILTDHKLELYGYCKNCKESLIS